MDHLSVKISYFDFVTLSVKEYLGFLGLNGSEWYAIFVGSIPARGNNLFLFSIFLLWLEDETGFGK